MAAIHHKVKSSPFHQASSVLNLVPTVLSLFLAPAMSKFSDLVAMVPCKGLVCPSLPSFRQTKSFGLSRLFKVLPRACRPRCCAQKSSNRLPQDMLGPLVVAMLHNSQVALLSALRPPLPARATSVFISWLALQVSASLVCMHHPHPSTAHTALSTASAPSNHQSPVAI
jgi:hypothetical protein